MRIAFLLYYLRAYEICIGFQRLGDHEIKAILTPETESKVSREYPVNLQKRRYNPEWESKFPGCDIPQRRMVRTAHTLLRLQKCCVLARPLSIPHSTTGKTQ